MSSTDAAAEQQLDDTPAATVTAPAAPTSEPPAAAPARPGTDVVLAPHDVPSSTAAQIAWAEHTYKSNALPAWARSTASLMIAQAAAVAFAVPRFVILSNMHIIEGRIGFDASFIRGLVRKAGHDIRVIEATRDVARVRIIRSDDPEPYVVEFSAQDAIDAELMLPNGSSKKDNWRKYRRAMLVARATTIAVREHCPDVLMCAGYVPEELGADTDENGTPLVVTSTRETDDEPVSSTPVSRGRVEELAQQWRTRIKAAQTVVELRALYDEAFAAGQLGMPLRADGMRVEGVLTERASELQAAQAPADAADDSQDEPQRGDDADHHDADDDVHDADVVAVETRDGDTSTVETSPRNETKLDEPSEPAPADDEPAPEPDPPHTRRTSARRNGLLKLLGEGGDIDALCDVEFGLPAADVSTERLLALHLRLAKEKKA